MNMERNNTTTTDECTLQMTQSPFIEPKASRIFRAIIMSVIILVSLAGNCAVCWVIWRYRGRKPFSYILVANLAIAELIGTACFPFLFHYDSSPWSWVFGDFMCHLVNPLSICCSVTVTFTIAAISVYRCLAILQPIQTRLMPRIIQSSVIIFSWIWGILLAIPSTISRTVKTFQVCHEFIMRCIEILPQWADVNIYTLILFIFQHAIPLVVMVIAYGIVAFKLNEHIQGNERHHIEMPVAIRSPEAPTQSNPTIQQMNIGRNCVAPAPPNISSISRRDSTIIEREQELLKIIYAIILIYFFCYLPYSVVFVIREFNVVDLYGWDYDYVVSLYSYLLQCLPSALHPICYLTMRRIHASDLIDLLLCRYKP